MRAERIAPIKGQRETAQNPAHDRGSSRRIAHSEAEEEGCDEAKLMV